MRQADMFFDFDVLIFYSQSTCFIFEGRRMASFSCFVRWSLIFYSSSHMSALCPKLSVEVVKKSFPESGKWSGHGHLENWQSILKSASGSGKIYYLIRDCWTGKDHAVSRKRYDECDNPPLTTSPVTAGFLSPAEQYVESPLGFERTADSLGIRVHYEKMFFQY